MVGYGRAVRILRAARGWSQGELARRSGYGASFISLVENEQRTLSEESRSTIAATFGVKVVLLTLLSSRREDITGSMPEAFAEELLDALLVESREMLPFGIGIGIGRSKEDA